jgi:hypothetical protein
MAGRSTRDILETPQFRRKPHNHAKMGGTGFARTLPISGPANFSKFGY